MFDLSKTMIIKEKNIHYFVTVYFKIKMSYYHETKFCLKQLR